MKSPMRRSKHETVSRKGKHHDKDSQHAQVIIAAVIDHLAQSARVPLVELAARVGAILVGETFHHLSALRGNTRQLARKAVAEVEVAESAHASKPQARRGRPPRSAEKGKVVNAQAAYWAAMTPRQRSLEFRRRQAKWSAEAKAKWGHSTGRPVGGKEAA